MKMTLASVAALAIAAPAFADHHKDASHQEKAEAKAEMSEAMKDEQGDMAATAEMAPEKVNNTVGEVLQADGEPSIQSDDDVVMADGHTVDEDVVKAAGEASLADNAIVVPGSADTVTTVSCPVGTTAQADMTCLITGEYDAELVGENEMVATD
jgi:hypothetical protein